MPFLDHELVELAATCPPELKLAHGGKGVLKEAARRVLPAEVIDRPKGYFPVPALTHLEGRYLDLVRDALYAPAAKERGLFRAGGYVDALLADPNGELTPLRGNELWQIGCWSCGCRATASTDRGRHPDATGTARTDRDRVLGRAPRATGPVGDAGRPGAHESRTPMADDVVLELGWGRLIFGQTFADPGKLAEVLRSEAAGAPRHLHLRARPARPGLPGARPSCSSTRSHTYRLRLAERRAGGHRRRRGSPAVRAAARRPRTPTR